MTGNLENNNNGSISDNACDDFTKIKVKLIVAQFSLFVGMEVIFETVIRQK